MPTGILVTAADNPVRQCPHPHGAAGLRRHRRAQRRKTFRSMFSVTSEHMPHGRSEQEQMQMIGKLSGNTENHTCGHPKRPLYRPKPHGIFATGGELAEW